jgi:UDP-N-acetylmuramate--alanine ligase
MDLNKIKKIYMIGIKGVGMTMLAQYLAANGKEVSGSDIAEKFMTDKALKEAGIKVIEKFDAGNIPAGADLIIYSSAYNKENNTEVAEALGGKRKTIVYAQALAEVFNQKYGIAVVGSHGKTTTAAWLGYVLDKAGISPSVMSGSYAPQFNGFGMVGKSDYLVAELDEYQNKLKYFQPKAVLLNNIDYDHPDFFPTPEDYQDVFIEFIKKIPKKGFLIANFDDLIISKIANVNCKGKVVSYAIDEEADYVAYDIKHNNGKQYFKVRMGGNEGGELGDFSVQLSGRHNISNALAVIVACIELGVELVDIRKYLEEFTGTARRMQKMGEFNGAAIIDDYAHHPTEIKATLAGARESYPKNKLIVVFHPHTFSRTKALLDDFAQSFGDADEVIVLDIYGSAREQHGGVHSRDLIQKIKNQKSKIKNILYIPTIDECEKYLRKNIERGDVVLLMGAGDVFKIGERLAK